MLPGSPGCGRGGVPPSPPFELPAPPFSPCLLTSVCGCEAPHFWIDRWKGIIEVFEVPRDAYLTCIIASEIKHVFECWMALLPRTGCKLSYSVLSL
jgi:hypothetical protein